MKISFASRAHDGEKRRSPVALRRVPCNYRRDDDVVVDSHLPVGITANHPSIKGRRRMVPATTPPDARQSLASGRRWPVLAASRERKARGAKVPSSTGCKTFGAETNKMRVMGALGWAWLRIAVPLPAGRYLDVRARQQQGRGGACTFSLCGDSPLESERSRRNRGKGKRTARGKAPAKGEKTWQEDLVS